MPWTIAQAGISVIQGQAEDGQRQRRWLDEVLAGEDAEVPEFLLSGRAACGIHA
jgi:hypothetical protein